MANAINLPLSQTALDQFNILKHQGGNGPYSQHPGWGISTDTPESCKVEQAHIYLRHGERYPTVNFARSARKVLNQIYNSKNITAKNDASFLNAYKSPSIYDLEKLEMETTEGPYSGYSSMFQAGSNFRNKYGHLYNNSQVLPFFTASQERIVVSAINVARGFLGAKWSEHARFVVLNETKEMGLNSLTPGNGCPNFNSSLRNEDSSKYANLAFDRSRRKLLADVPGLNITTTEYGMLMSLCMYDLNVQGSSPLCNYFSADDWVAYDHFRAINYYYEGGAGNPMVPALGGVVVNAAIKLLNAPASPRNATSLYFNFMHETNILALLTALGVANPPGNLSWENPEFNSRWRPSELVPMGARVAIERLVCTNATDPKVSEKYIRMTVNDAVFPHDKCTSGPGFSCPLDKFIEITKGRYPDAITQCGIGANYTQSKNLTFYWDWKNKTDLYKLPTNINITQF